MQANPLESFETPLWLCRLLNGRVTGDSVPAVGRNRSFHYLRVTAVAFLRLPIKLRRGINLDSANSKYIRE